MGFSAAAACSVVVCRPQVRCVRSTKTIVGFILLLQLTGISNAFPVVKETSCLRGRTCIRISTDNTPQLQGQIPKLSHASNEQLTNNQRDELSLNRRSLLNEFLSLTATVSALSFSPPAFAFEGGVGGLGKTKPDVGVTFLDGSDPIQNSQGIVSAELLLEQANKVVRVQFESPWPLLSTSSGLEARNLQQPESAFVQVIENASLNEKQIKSIIVDNLLGSQGKYGAYGTPSDIKIKPIRDLDLYSVTFTALTPSLRESERQLLIRFVEIGGKNLVLLVTGTTRLRYKNQSELLKQVADSFVAVEAPPLRK